MTSGTLSNSWENLAFCLLKMMIAPLQSRQVWYPTSWSIASVNRFGPLQTLHSATKAARVPSSILISVLPLCLNVSPVALPSQFDLLQNYPNPFNPETVIDFRIKEACDVVLVVYTVKGETIRTLVKDYRDAGSYSVVWDGRDDRGSRVPSGIYFYRMEAGTTHLYRKMILLR